MTKTVDSQRYLIAPCGLDCSRCVGCSNGNVAVHASEIAKNLGNNFEVYADRLKEFNPAMKNYSDFRVLLDKLAAPDCEGCRSENKICLPSCKISECVKEHEIEFCFECSEFPDCENTGLTEPLLTRWKTNNLIMHKKGVDEYIKLQAEKPRYP